MSDDGELKEDLIQLRSNRLHEIRAAEPEPCYKKQLRSHAYVNIELRSRSHFVFTRAPQPCLKRSLGAELWKTICSWLCFQDFVKLR